jgi:hypothetical protein
VAGQARRGRPNSWRIPGDGGQGPDDLRRAGARLDGLEASRGTALRKLEAARGRLEGAEGLERDRDALLEAHAGAPPGSPESLPPEGRRAVYRALRLAVRVGADGALTVGGVFGEVTVGFDAWNLRTRTPIGGGSVRDGSG